MGKFKEKLKKAWDETPAIIKVTGAITITSTSAALYYRHKLSRLEIEGAIFHRNAIKLMKAGRILEYKIENGKRYHRITNPNKDVQ